jgi:hypothetical protein
VTNLNPRNITAGLALAFSLLACGSLEAGVVTAVQVSGPVSVGTAAAGSYDFADFSGDFQATLVPITLTGTSTGVIQLITEEAPDYNIGDRLLLSLTNNTGVSLSGVTFSLTETAFDPSDTIDPSAGTFSSNTYTSDINQRLNSADGDLSLSSANAVLSVTFDSTLTSGNTISFYLPILDNGALSPFDLSETPSTASSGVPEPAMFVPLGLALIGLAGLRRRFGN